MTEYRATWPRTPDDAVTDFVDFESLTRPKSPNTFLITPDGLCRNADPDEPSPSFASSPLALFERVRQLVDDTSGWRLAGESPADLQLAFVAVTPLLRFKDDVDVKVIPARAGQSLDAPGAHIAVYSRSRIGWSDLGANARRVRTLVKNLSEAEEAS